MLSDRILCSEIPLERMTTLMRDDVHITAGTVKVGEDKRCMIEGQDVKVKLLAIKDGKLDLSIKKALPAPERPAQRNFQPRPAAVPRPAAAPRRPAVQAADTTPSGDLAFEDKLKQFLSSSERKMADLNRNISGKQGGRRRR